jgi:hypothetical protein
MTSTHLMLVEFYASVITYGAIAWIYFVPWARRTDFSSAATPILLAHSFRHVGLVYLIPQVVPELPPSSFAGPTAWGDVASAALAFVALLAVRRGGRAARPAAFLFNVVGFLDLGYATYTARQVELMTFKIGVAYLLPVIVVPGLLVSHIVLFWLLVSRHGSGHESNGGRVPA